MRASRWQTHGIKLYKKAHNQPMTRPGNGDSKIHIFSIKYREEFKITIGITTHDFAYILNSQVKGG